MRQRLRDRHSLQPGIGAPAAGHGRRLWVGHPCNATTRPCCHPHSRPLDLRHPLPGRTGSVAMPIRSAGIVTLILSGRAGSPWLNERTGERISPIGRRKTPLSRRARRTISGQWPRGPAPWTGEASGRPLSPGSAPRWPTWDSISSGPHGGREDQLQSPSIRSSAEQIFPGLGARTFGFPATQLRISRVVTG